jgi:DNA primase
VLCFDGDAAGQRAAYRALDRALPKLRPGRSFRVCLLTGGKDPDEILREKGALALREALKDTKPFVEVLFQREIELEPLDTPERKAGFKKRLRQLAAQIEDKDLAEAYREDLLGRYNSFTASRFNSNILGNRFVENFRINTSRNERSQPAARGFITSAKSLAKIPERLSASLAVAVILHPRWLLENIEDIEAYGFGDEIIDSFSKKLVSLSFELSLDLPDSELQLILEKKLREAGLSALVASMLSIACDYNSPSFLKNDIALSERYSRWLHIFRTRSRLTALERILKIFKDEARNVTDKETYVNLHNEWRHLGHQLYSASSDSLS